jgi:hypothetical protein
VAGLRQRLAKIGMVVELAVLDSPDRARVVAHRLMAAVEIDDAEAARAERDPRCAVRAAVVRAAMRHRVRHAVEHLGRNDFARDIAAHLNDSADPAHPVESTDGHTVARRSLAQRRAPL